MILYDTKEEQIICEFIVPSIMYLEHWNRLEEMIIDTINEEGNITDLVFYAEDREMRDLKDRLDMVGNVYVYRDKMLPILNLCFRGIPIKKMCERKVGAA